MTQSDTSKSLIMKWTEKEFWFRECLKKSNVRSVACIQSPGAKNWWYYSLRLQLEILWDVPLQASYKAPTNVS